MNGPTQILLAVVDSMLECKECQEPLNDPRMLRCGHSFCRACPLDLYERQKQTQFGTLACTVCRVRTHVEYAEEECDEEEDGEEEDGEEEDGEEEDGEDEIVNKDMKFLPVDFKVNSLKEVFEGTKKPSAESVKLLLEAVDRATQCYVCFGMLKDPRSLDCGHSFCRTCLVMNWDVHMDRQEFENEYYNMYRRALPCPVCRQMSYIPDDQMHELPREIRMNSLIEASKAVQNTPSRKRKRLECSICSSDEVTYVCTDHTCLTVLCADCLHGDQHTRTGAVRGLPVCDERLICYQCNKPKSRYCEQTHMLVCELCALKPEYSSMQFSGFSPFKLSRRARSSFLDTVLEHSTQDEDEQEQ